MLKRFERRKGASRLPFVRNEAICIFDFALPNKFIPTEEKPQISPLRYPEFLPRLLALANFMRLS